MNGFNRLLSAKHDDKQETYLRNFFQLSEETPPVKFQATSIPLRVCIQTNNFAFESNWQIWIQAERQKLLVAILVLFYSHTWKFYLLDCNFFFLKHTLIHDKKKNSVDPIQLFVVVSLLHEMIVQS